MQKGVHHLQSKAQKTLSRSDKLLYLYVSSSSSINSICKINSSA